VRTALGGDVEPKRMRGGLSADLFRVGDDEVVRVLPRGTTSLAEAEIQRAVAALGYPAPAVHATGRLDDDRPYVVMEYVGGVTMFDALDRSGHYGARRGSWRR